MSNLVSQGAVIVADAGRWWTGDIYRVADDVFVAACRSGMYRVLPGAGFWMYAGVWRVPS